MGAGRAIFNQGTLTVNSDTLTDDQAIGGNGSSGTGGGGGGGYNFGGGGGFGNSGTQRGGGGGMGGGIFNMFGTLTVTNSTLAGNTAQGGTGGGSGYGGAIVTVDGSGLTSV